MVALVLAPIDGSLGLVVGAIVSALVVAGLIALSPVIEVRDGWLRVGRARIELDYLGAAEALSEDAARTARGPELRATSWHLLRGGIDGVVRVAVEDPEDPVAHWVFSSRTPERITALIGQSAQD